MVAMALCDASILSVSAMFMLWTASVKSSLTLAALKLKCDSMKRSERFVACFDRGVCLVVRQTFRDAQRREHNPVIEPISVFVEPYLNRVRRPIDTGIQAHEIGGEPLRKHSNRSRWQIDRGRPARRFGVQ